MSAAPKAQAAPGEGGASAAADAAPSGPAHESSAGGGWLRSLRARLLAGALAWIALALALAGWGLRNLFQEHITAQWQAQLAVQLDQLSAAVNLSPGGSITLAPEPGDPRLSRPLSGVYWQIDRLQARGDGAFTVTQPAAARSRSLWDQTLPLPATATAPPPSAQDGSGGVLGGGAGSFAAARLQDGQGRQLLALTRILQLPEDEAPPLRLTVAADHALVAEPLQGFTRLLLIALGTLAAGLAAAVAVQLHLALRPLHLLRQRLAAVRRGEAGALQGRFPQEVQPLVSEFNHVLGENARMVQRARTQAGNLAHAVHTPLSIMGNAAAVESGPLARLVQEQVDNARRQVDYHLARARAAAATRATGLRTPVRPAMQALARTMQRLHAGRGVTFDVQAGEALAFKGEPQDLYEMLGNLMDNAGKWAARRITAAAAIEGGTLLITVDDDGPGIPAGQRQRIFQRGARLDENRPGSGLGLDIVRDMAETYGGRIEAGESPAGGLRMSLRLPAA